MRKSLFNDEFLMVLGPIISRLFTCLNEEKKGACSSPISMDWTDSIPGNGECVLSAKVTRSTK
jgi:hypothetical protein